MNYLYHGSTTQSIKVLEPRKRHTPSAAIEFPAIYATPLPAYAAAHSFPWTSDEGFDLKTTDGNIEIIVPSRHKKRLDVPVSIYTVDARGFEHTKDEETGYTWHATQPIEIIEERKYPSVTRAIEELGGTVSCV